MFTDLIRDTLQSKGYHVLEVTANGYGYVAYIEDVGNISAPSLANRLRQTPFRVLDVGWCSGRWRAVIEERRTP